MPGKVVKGLTELGEAVRKRGRKRKPRGRKAATEAQKKAAKVLGITVNEAKKLERPILAVVDTNGDPEDIDYPMPGNDDAVRAIELFASKVAEAIIEGKKRKLEKELEQAKKEEEMAEEQPPSPEAANQSEEEATSSNPEKLT